MASIKDDLPAPVGPVTANRSSWLRSRQVGCLKAVKPSSSSRSGLISLLVQQAPEQRHRFLRRRAAAAVGAGVEALEQLDGSQSLPVLLVALYRFQAARPLDVHRRGQLAAHQLRQVRDWHVEVDVN